MLVIKSDNVGNMFVDDEVVAKVVDIRLAKEMIEMLNKEDSKYYYSLESDDYKLYKF